MVPGPCGCPDVLRSPSGLGPQGTHQGPSLQLVCVGRTVWGERDGQGRKLKHLLYPPRSAPMSSSLLSRCRSFPSGSLKQCPFLWGPWRGDGWSPFSPMSQAVASVPLCLCLRSVWGGTFMHFVSPSQLPSTPSLPAWIPSLVVQGSGPPSMYPPPSLLPPPASLGFCFDTNL
uniref:Uncharacterized protein n=1 Tax=Myotis myotis TaxID=51298 RepID=A0A7J7VIY1_MYOMY|nr:hypothetical protein mMyoMyo1_008357 [Myotis myotis]